MDNQQLATFFNQAKDSRLKHSTEDRLIALEMMVAAIGASLEGTSRDDFLKSINSFSENFNPMKDSTIKAIADLNVLSSNFKTFFNQSADE